mmetsp:Transcript_8208/g.20204  ORF Transcript_8208/g.20204 Transcript_8208/m.20204 type:complete len:481 (+) Transcript_8208:77-1519(+)
MVNLVVHQDSTSSVQDVGVVNIKSTASATGRVMPVSPLTQNESMFGTGPGPFHHSEEREQPPLMSVSSDLEMICDYDRSITKLYEMLESSQWNNVCSRCQTHPEEVLTWVVRRDANGNVRWKLLPLHAAVIFKAPLSLIGDLLKAHPIAAAQRDDQGLLPLHLAFRHKSNEAVIEKLFSQYPGGVMVKDQRGRFPLDHGKEMTFSAKLMGLYAETFTKCQNTGSQELGNEAEMKSTYENRLTTMKGAYEARILSLLKSHEETRETMKIQADKDLQRNNEIHMEEIEEMKVQLARSKMAGERAPALEGEIQALSISLGDANRELTALRRLVREQNEQKKLLLEETRNILKDQIVVRDRCNKQQEQLDQAQKLREQLLRTLLQKENGKATQTSNEICRLSNDSVARAEKLLSKFALGRSDLAIEEPPRELATSPYQEQRVVQRDSQLLYHADTEDNPSDCGDHGDDISEITESSYVRPFGDR